MRQIPLLMLCILLLPHPAVGATDLDAAVQDFCKCGFPPSSTCMKNLARKYPEIDNSSELQKRVMAMTQNSCEWASHNVDGSVQDMVGNQNLDPSTLPASTAKALDDVNKIVSSTENCSTKTFTVAIPQNWQCRKQRENASDVTLYTNGNKLNVSVGKNQGRTSCTVIPGCTSTAYTLSENFDTKLYKHPLVGTYEYAGAYKKDNSFRLSITSINKPTEAQLQEIRAILDSFRKL